MINGGVHKTEKVLPYPLRDFRLKISPILKKYSFSCVRCGDCCRNRNIWINLSQARKIAHQLRLPFEEANHRLFRSCSGEKTEFGTILSPNARKIKLIDNVCPFLHQSNINHTSCRIYSFRPSICRCFPFTYSILASNKLILILPALNSAGTISCKGLRAWNAKEGPRTAFEQVSQGLDEIIEDIRITLSITNLKDQLNGLDLVL
jgi:Fe-S-cluster containining protein